MELKKKWLVGVLYYGGIDREHDKCIQALRCHPYIETVMEMHGCPYIDIGRSLIATKVLDDENLAGLVFFDHDMIFDVEEVEKLIESAEECRGVVGAAYSMRRPGHMIGGIDGSTLQEGEKVVFFDGGKSHKASYLGMGMTAIHRDALLRLVARADEKHAERRKLLDVAPQMKEVALANGLPVEAIDDALKQVEESLRPHDLPRTKSGLSDADVVPFFSMIVTKDTYYGEDISFCLRCHDAGVPVRLDTRVRVYHKGSYCYGLEDCGMVVPYCHRLESVSPTRSTEPQHTPYGINPDVQAALDAQRAAAKEATEQNAIPTSKDPMASRAGEDAAA